MQIICVHMVTYASHTQNVAPSKKLSKMSVEDELVKTWSKDDGRVGPWDVVLYLLSRYLLRADLNGGRLVR